jgi:serine/threonine protein kinase
MAPEMFTDDEYSPAVDVYSFSLIVYELLVGEAAFPATLGLGALMEKVGAGARPPLPCDMDETVKGFISWCWSADPSLRDSFELILNLLRGIDFKITPGVDSRRVYEFLSFAGCDWRPVPPPAGGRMSAGKRKGRGRALRKLLSPGRDRRASTGWKVRSLYQIWERG